MTQSMVSFKVLIEDTGEEITLIISHDDAEKAVRDEAFLRVLVAKEIERRCNNTNVVGSSQQSDTAASPLSEEGESSFSTNVIHNVGTDSEKSLFIWPSQCVFLLLGKYEEHIAEFASFSKRHNKIWESIAAQMRKINANYGISASQCQSKMNGLKKMYKKIIDHNNVSGNDRQTWLYFDRMDELFGKTGWARPRSTASEVFPSPSTSQESYERPVKKAKADIVMEKFLEEMKKNTAEKEKNREELKLAMFNDMKSQRERQHQEKLEVLKKLGEALAGKKIFD